MRVGFIGTGKIAAPLARAVRRKGFTVLVSRRNEAVSHQLKRSDPAIEVVGNQDVVDGSDVVVLCLPGGVAPRVLPPLRFREDVSVVSVMAEVDLTSLRSFCAPAHRIIRTVPLGLVEHGGYPIPTYPEIDLVTALFGPENPVLQLRSESALRAFFAASTSLPLTLALLVHVTGWLGVEIDDDAAAERWTVAAMSALLASIPGDGQDRLRHSMEGMLTEGGLGEEILRRFDRAGLKAVIGLGLRSILDRLEVE